MSEESDPRRWSEVLLTDPELVIYLATVDDLVRISGEAKRHLWGAKWTSEGALRRQVKPGSSCIICPAFRNGGPVDEPESYRCYVWFIDGPAGAGRVSLIDVSVATLAQLRVASSVDQLKRVTRTLLGSFELARLD
jgi:hypothetical protein